MLLDFADIFDMVEILSVNVCVGVGSYVSEDSSTERAIQAFCVMSFMIVSYGYDILMIYQVKGESPSSARTYEVKLTLCSVVFQNLPFLVIRIVVWAQYKLYSLKFLVKNVTVIIFLLVKIIKNRRQNRDIKST